MATRMHNPPHPGEVLQDTVVSAAGISVSELARKLGVSRVTLSRVINGRAAVSADMALRLAAALDGSAESWLQMQAAYDLWHAAKKRRKVEPLKLAA
jgi:addiction module HigA family antidote